ncbi:cytochrome P450 monooxygenase 109, partial [Heterobasidion irregulare TC 32-1]
GDLVYQYTPGEPLLIINSAKVADDLLEKRGAIYSSRPMRTMIAKMGWEWSFAAMKYGSDWRKHRALFQKYFHSRAAPRYEPIQIMEAHTLLRNLSHNPNNFEHYLQRSASALAMKISYGHDITEEDDLYVSLAKKGMSSLIKVGVHGTYLVDYLPFLRHIPSWFPGAGFKRQAYEWRADLKAMREQPFEMVKRRMETGTAIPCVTTLELEKSPVKEIDVSMIQCIAAIFYAAGADTMAAGVLSFFLAMMTHPDIQRKAQAEIDAVIGTDRLPTFKDRSNLPFVSCLLWECLRWSPIAPMAVPHAPIQDDVYEGYWIPKGTTILPNVWGMLHDEEKYPDAFKFMPERFADPQKNAKSRINEPPHIAFGFGRRVCPGRWVALDHLWITMASILAVFTIAKPKDPEGNIVEQDIDVTIGSVSRPKPFKCSLVPRSEAARALIRQTEEQQSFN